MANQIPLAGLQISVIKEMQKGLEKAANLLYDKMKEKAGLVDHSLEDMEKAGHPYALRDPHPLHPRDEIHRQSSTLWRNIQIRQVNQYTYRVGVDEARVPYVRSVIYGTRYMIPRNFPLTAYLENKDAINDIFDSSLGDGVKLKNL